MSIRENIKADFPLFCSLQGEKLVYFDNAATTQKPEKVIAAIAHYYRESNANVHRSIYPLAYQSTMAYEGARQRVQTFLNARQSQEIIFVRGTTEGINLVAQSFLSERLQPGDEVLITALEHHANLVPWQQWCFRKGARLRVIPLLENGALDLDGLDQLLTARTKMLAVGHISNTLGTVNPIRRLIREAHRRQVPVLVDAAQSALSHRLDVQDLDCDFLVFSGHKVFGPMGIGVLYGKEARLREMPPYQMGGEMIRSVHFDETTFADPPQRFEAGTPNVAGAVGLAAALDYVQELGQENIYAHLRHLLEYGTEKLTQVDGLRIYGQAPEKSAIISFLLEGIHPHDLATWLGEAGIAVRAGHHCTQPIMERYGIPGTVRVSFSVYNTPDEIDKLVAALQEAQRFFKF